MRRHDRKVGQRQEKADVILHLPQPARHETIAMQSRSRDRHRLSKTSGLSGPVPAPLGEAGAGEIVGIYFSRKRVRPPAREMLITCLRNARAAICRTAADAYLCSEQGSPPAAAGTGSKGNPVRIRDYPRSCELRREAAHSQGHCPLGTGRRAAGASQKTCLAGRDVCPRDMGLRRNGFYT